MTKLDVLSGLEKIKVCVAYKIEGNLMEGLPASIMDWERIDPIYETLPGWKEDISQVKKQQDLPKEALGYVRFLEKALGRRISLVSVGPSREQMIVLE